MKFSIKDMSINFGIIARSFKNSKFVGSLLAFTFLILISGCANYRPKSRLTALNTNIAVSEGIKNKSNISFEYHIFDKCDCKKYLDRDVIGKGF